MTESDQPDGGDDMPSIHDYDDFYDLLGVNRAEDEEVIMDRSRKLLGKFHPDVSDHPEADQLFKAINRAQSVLTDKEQRTIYNRIGHERYVEKREEGGEMTLSEDVNVTDDFEPSRSSSPSTSPSQSDDEDGSTVNVDFGSSSRNERNTWVEDESDQSSEPNSYQSITDFDMELKPEEALKHLYRNMWTMRLVVTFALGVSIIYLWFESPATIFDFWSGIGVPMEYGIGAATIVGLSISAAVMAISTGLYTRQYMKSMEDEITIEDSTDERSKEKSNVRGVNTSSTRSHDKSGNAWGANSRYKNVREQSEVKNIGDERTNKSLRIGSRSLFVTIALMLFGTFMGGAHPWGYLEAIIDGSGVEASLWWEFGGEGLYELAILVNAAGALLMFTVGVFGVVFVTHGLSKEVWYRRYFTELNVQPIVWDAGIAMLSTAFAAALVLSSVDIATTTISSLPDIGVEYLAAGDGVTSLSIAIGAMTLLYGSYLAFLFRAKLSE